MNTLIHQRVESARTGQNPTVICQMPSGWLVMADRQILRGYCILLADPVSSSLNDISQSDRSRFLLDMTIAGDALLETTGAYRINYGILGNTDPALHAHIFPRFTDEPADLRRGPAWFYDWESAPAFDVERDRLLMQAMAAAVLRRLQQNATE
jgi:diadenosine tetraphosphate (Ap4A) HIT family hydrolase